MWIIAMLIYCDGVKFWGKLVSPSSDPSVEYTDNENSGYIIIVIKNCHMLTFVAIA